MVQGLINIHGFKKIFVCSKKIFTRKNGLNFKKIINFKYYQILRQKFKSVQEFKNIKRIKMKITEK